MSDEDSKHSDSPPLYNAPALEAQPVDTASKRPPIRYSSPAAFFTSVKERIRSVLTRRFLFSLLAGQVVSVCITCTNVTTTELVIRNWALPTTQTVFLYFSLFIIYVPYTIYKYGFKGWAEMLLRDGWKYIILAACDVEGNFMVVKAYEYTDLLSCMLLDAWAIPVCLFVSWIYFRTKYHWTQLLGVFICVLGLGLLVCSDELTDKDYQALARGKGDGLMIAGATLYGITNATEELFVVGSLGMFGFIICMSQAAGLEHNDWFAATWNGANVGLILAYTAAMFILYTVAPILYRMASSGYYNLSLLSSDFYGLIFGLGLYHYKPYWLYFVAYVIVLIGLITYFWYSAPEDQATLAPEAPSYVQERRKELQGPQRIAGNV
ncbi:hypothetical protein D9757_004813 [Collybiopsis confluens]|uniref:DUF914-domain-containing protein n=1 Tax=Collybiopsis confluens TaxID=2823264 RepID=A0A8H5HSX7_9AGAR|nr:hypothetical protein D9757_004813 [Collybiopsis confluens]